MNDKLVKSLNLNNDQISNIKFCMNNEINFDYNYEDIIIDYINNNLKSKYLSELDNDVNNIILIYKTIYGYHILSYNYEYNQLIECTRQFEGNLKYTINSLIRKEKIKKILKCY